MNLKWKNFTWALTLSAGLAANAGSARADLISPTSTLTCDGATTSLFGTATCNGGYVEVSAEPYSAATAQFLLSNNGNVSGTATLNYWIDVTGGSPGDRVPFDIDAVLITDGLGTDGGTVINTSAQLWTNFAGSSTAQQSVSCGNVLRAANSCSDPDWSGNLLVYATEGAANRVRLTASAQISGSGFAYAYADPYIYIDPTFAAANPQYSLVINVSNDLPAAPEPGTWLLLGCGLLGLGFALRQRDFTDAD